ncbi:MAG TPA: ATP-binding protein [Candidatus Dormibacteraeota bacterium]
MGDLHALDSARLVNRAPSDSGGLFSPTVANVPAVRGRRSRLSRDLHDGVGQAITTLLVEVRVAMERGQATRDDLLIIEQEAENALRSVRALAYSVRQRSLVADPLGQAQRYAERLINASGASLRWIDQRTSRRLSVHVARELAWTIRESITNALDHGLANTIEVRLLEAEGRIRVTIRDNGVGFEPNALQLTPEGQGLGLLGNAERMAQIGGIFSIRSRPGEGTLVILEAPRFLRRNLSSKPSDIVPSQLEPDAIPSLAVAAI